MAEQIYKVRDPTGAIREIKGPEGATDEQVISQAQRLFAAPERGGQPSAVDPVRAAINKSPTAGIADAALALGTGALAGPVSGFAGLAGAVLPGPEGQGASWVRKTQDALSYAPKTPIGQGITDIVTYPFRKIAEFGDAAGAATADRSSPGGGAAVNTAIQAIPLLLGRVSPAGGPVPRTAAKVKNAQADAATTQARDAGYVVPPTQANPSLLNQVVEGFAGKIKTAQTASIKNQDVTNGLVRKGLGIPDDVPLNVESLQRVRSEAGTAYERVRDAGDVIADPAYGKALDALTEPYLRASKDFPKAAKTEVLNTIEALRVKGFDAGSAVDQIRILRADADKAYAGRDAQLGKTYKGLANALEEQLGRHIETAMPDALADFRLARETIAKSYTVEKHLKSNGNVDAQGLANELKRKPLTGDIRTAAEFGSNFRKAAQVPEKIGGVPMSPLDHAFSGASVVGALASGHPGAAVVGLAPYARIGARKLVTSDAYQNAFANPPSYGPSGLSRLQALLGETHRNPLIPALEISEGQKR